MTTRNIWIIIGAIILILSLVGNGWLYIHYEAAQVEELEAEIQELSALISHLENGNVMWESEVIRLTSDWRAIERGARIAQELDSYDSLIQLIYKLAPPVRPLVEPAP